MQLLTRPSPTSVIILKWGWRDILFQMNELPAWAQLGIFCLMQMVKNDYFYQRAYSRSTFIFLSFPLQLWTFSHTPMLWSSPLLIKVWFMASASPGNLQKYRTLGLIPDLLNLSDSHAYQSLRSTVLATLNLLKFSKGVMKLLHMLVFPNWKHSLPHMLDKLASYLLLLFNSLVREPAGW